MRLLICLLPLLTLYRCSNSYAGLTIPARQEFVLGEYMTAKYTASVSNRGKVPVILELYDRAEARVVSDLQIIPGKSERLTVPEGREVHLLNPSGHDAELLVEMSRGVAGMRLQSLDEPPAPAASPAGPPAADLPAGPRSHRYRRKVPPGSCLEVGRGEWMRYRARVHAAGAPVHLRVLDETGEETVMAFGLGAGSSETVALDRGEWLRLCNEGKQTLRLRVRLDKKVTGGTLVKSAR